MKNLKCLLTAIAIVIAVASCKKEKSTTPSPSPSPTQVNTDTTVNVDLVLVAYNPGGMAPAWLDITARWADGGYSTQTLRNSDISVVYWYNAPSPPTISSPCTATSIIPITMKFSKTKLVTLDIDLDNSTRHCTYDPITYIITNSAGTFQIDRTCKPGKWVILCSK